VVMLPPTRHVLFRTLSILKDLEAECKMQPQ